MRRSLILVGCVVLGLPAHAFVAENNLRVNPLPQAGTFEVINQPGAGPREFWCAAADYARMSLGARGNARIHILNGPAQSQTRAGEKAVSFTMVGDHPGRRPGQNGNYSLSLSEAGFNISVAHGQSFCNDPDPKDPVWPVI